MKVINVCAKAGRIDQAERILGKFTSFSTSSTTDSKEIEDDMTPSVRTWNVLLSSCSTDGDISKANHFWTQMKANRIQPDIVSYNTLLNCYVHSPKQRRRGGKINARESVDSIFPGQNAAMLKASSL